MLSSFLYSICLFREPFSASSWSISQLSVFLLYRCVGGFLQLHRGGGTGSEWQEDTTDVVYNPDELAICGPNERYAPPIVMFKDSESANSASAAMLLFRVDETTSRSQFLAHFAFPSVDNEETGLALKGATKLEGTGWSIKLYFVFFFL